MLRFLSLLFGSLVLTCALTAATPQLQQRTVLRIDSSPEWALSQSTITSDGEDFLLVRMEANVLRWWGISASGELRDEVEGELRLVPFHRFPIAQALSNGRDFLILWTRYTDANRARIEYVRVGAGGQLLDHEPQVLADVPWGTRDGEFEFRAASDGRDYLVVWPDVIDYFPRLTGSFVRATGARDPLTEPLAPSTSHFDLAFDGLDYVLVWSQATDLLENTDPVPGCALIPFTTPAAPLAWNLFGRKIDVQGQLTPSSRITMDRHTHRQPRVAVNGNGLTVFYASNLTCRDEQRFRTIPFLDSTPEAGRVIEPFLLSNREAAFVTHLHGLAVAAYTVNRDIKAFLIDPSQPDHPVTVFLANDPNATEVVGSIASAGRSLAVVNGRSIIFFSLPRARGIRR